ncbi:hypothetical protein B7494_g3379 [Chlorociboria aeruginascens]|nr:hypothetical protein B7494_g3379 [Chlorociboria aeruginascens]
MSLLSLSNELLIQILSHISKRRDLAIMSRSCKLLNALAEPILYTTFQHNNTVTLGSFLKAILNKPERALRVKHFIARMEDYCLQYSVEERATLRMTIFDTEQRMKIDQAIQRAVYWRPGPEDDIVCKSLANYLNAPGNWDGAMALVISLLPNLEMLDIRSSSGGVKGPKRSLPLLEGVLLRASFDRTPLSFDRLKYLSMESFVTGLDEVVQHLRVPSIIKFKGHRIADNRFNPDRYSPLFTTDLCLADSSLGRSAMYHFLRHFISLKRFAYEHNLKIPPFPFFFDRVDIGQSISHLAHSLEELILRDANNYGICFGLLGPLKAFHRLRKIDAMAYILFGNPARVIQSVRHPSPLRYQNDEVKDFVEALPSSLENLCIRDCHRFTFVGLLDYFSSDNVLLPENLEKIVLIDGVEESSKESSKFPEHEWEELQKIAAKKGIVLERYEKEDDYPCTAFE